MRVCFTVEAVSAFTAIFSNVGQPIEDCDIRF
jgi:hypothetical protein